MKSVLKLPKLRQKIKRKKCSKKKLIGGKGIFYYATTRLWSSPLQVVIGENLSSSYKNSQQSLQSLNFCIELAKILKPERIFPDYLYQFLDFLRILPVSTWYQNNLEENNLFFKKLSRFFNFAMENVENVWTEQNLFPTPLVGGGRGTIYSNGFFLFSQFWPIDMFVVEKCEWYH